MKTIPSFTVDHNRLLRGIYVSRRDSLPGGDIITTFDIRLTEPNRQTPVAPAALHAMEHLAATFLRNHKQWGQEIIYWGPMGCCTGNYLIVKGEFESSEIVPLVISTMEFIASFNGDIPGASPAECGNYSFMDLEGAKAIAKQYIEEVLYCIEESNLIYPQ